MQLVHKGNEPNALVKVDILAADLVLVRENVDAMACPYKVVRFQSYCGITLELPHFVVRFLGNFSGCVSLSCELVRRQVSKRGVGSVIVVVAPPFLDPFDGVGHRQEP